MKTWLRPESREEVKGRAAFLRERQIEGMKFWNSCLSCLPCKQEDLTSAGCMGNKAELEVKASLLHISAWASPLVCVEEFPVCSKIEFGLIKKRGGGSEEAWGHTGTQQWTTRMSEDRGWASPHRAHGKSRALHTGSHSIELNHLRAHPHCPSCWPHVLMQSLFANMCILCLLSYRQGWASPADEMTQPVSSHCYRERAGGDAIHPARVLLSHAAPHQIPHQTSRKPRTISSMKLTVRQTLHGIYPNCKWISVRTLFREVNAGGRFVLDKWSDIFVYPSPSLRTFGVQYPSLSSAPLQLHPICCSFLPYFLLKTRKWTTWLNCHQKHLY